MEKAIHYLILGLKYAGEQKFSEAKTQAENAKREIELWQEEKRKESQAAEE